ncbi:hypothetical protein PsorP6_012439 [Peronosclerospora sorghi]|uniref:Uncharacterized protein n=1 Tax=Peronosclerospora sorghi TaxID=230839 RepID=A0ACC0WJI3_9STRA|nr:hypothetical protein PsorP6_012439 [Peronosclerospora sorghi]
MWIPFPLHQVLGLTPVMASCHQAFHMIMWSTLRIEHWRRGVALLRRDFHERCDRHSLRIQDDQDELSNAGGANERIEERLASL